MSKIITSVALAGMVALSLVACGTPAANDCVATPSGPNSSKVTVDGAFGTEPSVKIPSPFDAEETERAVVIAGDGGEPAADGMVVNANFAVYNASTGDKFEATEYTSDSATPFLIDEAKSFPGIYKALHCSSVGDRIIAIIPPADMFGADGPNFGVGATDSLVFVFDVTKIGPAPSEAPSATPEPLPTPAEWTTDVPTVDLSGDTPVVTLPKTDPPADLMLKVLTEGDGEVVTTSSTVTIDYQGTSWDTGEIFDQSYTRGEPSTFPATGVIQGFAAAMVGQKVGATVLVTIPPQYAYGTDPNAHALGNQTLVFLIQIRGIS